LDRIDLFDKLKGIPHTPKLIILSRVENDISLTSVFGAGAWGYLSNNSDLDEIVFAIKTVYAGERYICSALALRLLDDHLKNTEKDKEKLDIDFSNRELEVLYYIAEGHTSKEIGERLLISSRTIEGHRQALLDKTNTRNTAMLIRFAHFNNLLSMV
ncbi:MAG: response regulator transcription factor, partial [Pedobacter sp.]|nr:response regulator transcription factor [Pedobacter sp.]